MRQNDKLLRAMMLAVVLWPGITWSQTADDAEIIAARESDLRLRLQSMLEGVDDVPLPLIIEVFSGHKVIPWNGEERELLAEVADSVIEKINSETLRAKRANEAGNKVEAFVEQALHDAGFATREPSGPSGRARSSGYPDLMGVYGDFDFYIEVKTYNAKTVRSTQRTFYLSPSTDFKVTRDAFHLLIAVELEDGDGDIYFAKSVKWLDLSGLKCDLKYELNASNRDLYDADGGLVIFETDQ